MTTEGNVRRGIIQSIDNGNAIVSTPRRGACESCSEKGFCLAVGRDQPELIEAVNKINADVGQMVEVTLPSGTELTASFFLYLFPLLGLIAGGFVGMQISAYIGTDENVAAIASALVGFALALATGMLVDRRVKTNTRFRPEITALASNLGTCSTQSDHSSAES